MTIDATLTRSRNSTSKHNTCSASSTSSTSSTHTTENDCQDIPNITEINAAQEYAKMFKFKTEASKNIRADVMYYAIKNLDRTTALFTLANYVPVGIADEIENGILEFTLIQINNEKPDVIDFTVNIYCDKIRDICQNLDLQNTRVNNKTLTPSLIGGSTTRNASGSMNPYFVAFLSPQQMHPIRWAKELERQRVAEEAHNNKKVTDIYKCYRCKEKKCTTKQIQTRSMDEPMTVFVTCLVCYNTFTK